MEEVSQIVNAGVGPTSYQFLCSILTDGTDGDMSRFELFRKRQRLDALLTATPEQLKGMEIEIAELKQILKISEARLTQTWNKLEPLLVKVDKLITFCITEPRLSALCKMMKKRVDQLRQNVTIIHEAFRAEEEALAELRQVAPRAAHEGEYVTEMVQLLQKHNNLIKSAGDDCEQFFAQAEIFDVYAVS